MTLYCKRLPAHWSRAGLHLDQPFVGWFVCHRAKNGQIHRTIDVDCPLVTTSIGETLFQARKEEYLVGSVFCIVDNGSFSL